MNKFLLVCVFFLLIAAVLLTPDQSSAQRNKSTPSKDSLRADISFVRSEKGQLLFKATYHNEAPTNTILYIRDQDGDLVFEEKIKILQGEKIYRIPVNAARELTFEWVNPKPVVYRKFKIETIEKHDVRVIKL
ncbi:hypothetical protein [Flavihumibacter sp.]|uniref:hypothetical protein n=1 Tax=Flavihumibacter sp. TaxID=1913981 RepID=UPI002FC5F53F|nr:hypothetical protein [Flavihumibacter sediminis]